MDASHTAVKTAHRFPVFKCFRISLVIFSILGKQVMCSRAQKDKFRTEKQESKRAIRVSGCSGWSIGP